MLWMQMLHLKPYQCSKSSAFLALHCSFWYIFPKTIQTDSTQRYTKLSLLRFNCIYKSFSSVYDLLKNASLKKEKTARLIRR